MYQKDGEFLVFFIKELLIIECISQIDWIFRSGDRSYLKVNHLSSKYETKDKFYEILQMLPENYQNELLNETIPYSEVYKDYCCSLIGGTALMGF